MAEWADIVDEAVRACGDSQAELARQLKRTPSAVGNWRMGRFKPDFESCLRLARITGRTPAEVLNAAGHDPEVLPVEGPLPSAESGAEVARLRKILRQALNTLEAAEHSNGTVIQAYALSAAA